MKNIISIILALLMSFSLTLFVGCNDNSCYHEWEWYSGTVTCKNNGYIIYKCNKCSETKKENESAYGCYDMNNDNYCDECYSYIGGASNNEDCSHVYDDATCLKPKTCIYCGHTVGTKSDHYYAYNDKGHCEYCGQERPNYYLTYSLGDTFIFESYERKFQIKIGSTYEVEKANQWLINEGICNEVVRLPVTITNKGSTTERLSDYLYTLFTKNGTEVNSSVEIPYDDDYYMDDIRSGGQMTTCFYFNYTGDGEYVIEFIDTEKNQITVVINVKKN